MVYKKKKGWKPGSNTRCYLPLENNLTDESGNGNSGSLDYSPNISYVSNGYINVAQVASGKGIKMPNLTFNSGSGTTVSFWGRMISHSNRMCLISIDTATDDDHSIIRIQQFDRDTSKALIAMGAWGISAQQKTDNFDNRHLYTIVYNGSIITVYFDKQVLYTGSISGTQTSILHTLLGQKGDNQGGTKQMSKYIIELKARTSDDVASYYDQTKSTYGL